MPAASEPLALRWSPAPGRAAARSRSIKPGVTAVARAAGDPETHRRRRVRSPTRDDPTRKSGRPRQRGVHVQGIPATRDAQWSRASRTPRGQRFVSSGDLRATSNAESYTQPREQIGGGCRRLSRCRVKTSRPEHVPRPDAPARSTVQDFCSRTIGDLSSSPEHAAGKATSGPSIAQKAPACPPRETQRCRHGAQRSYAAASRITTMSHVAASDERRRTSPSGRRGAEQQPARWLSWRRNGSTATESSAFPRAIARSRAGQRRGLPR
jgi:hypothetical protein